MSAMPCCRQIGTLKQSWVEGCKCEECGYKTSLGNPIGLRRGALSQCRCAEEDGGNYEVKPKKKFLIG